MVKCSYIKPIKWVPVSDNVIKIYGYNSFNKKVEISIHTYHTFLLKFNKQINPYIINTIIGFKSYKSTYDSTQLLVRINLQSNNKKLFIESLYKLDSIIEVIHFDNNILQSFWQYYDIGPFKWLKVDDSTNQNNLNNGVKHYSTNPDRVPNHKSTEFVPIMLNECDISVSNDTMIDNIKNLIWDVRYINNKILFLSIITINNNNIKGYIIYNTKFGGQYLKTGRNNIEIIKENSNRSIMNKFIDIYIKFDPYRQIFYSSKNNENRQFINKLVEKCNFDLYNNDINDEIINLYDYYQSYHSYYDNDCFTKIKHKLMNNDYIMTTNSKILTYSNSDNFTDIIENAYYDSYNIYECIINNKIIDDLHNISNILCCSISQIYNQNIYDIFYNLLKCSNINHPDITDIFIKPFKCGLYKNVHVYDYIDIYRKIMLLSTDKLTQIIAIKLENAPSNLIYNFFYSKYVNKNELLPKLKLIFSSMSMDKIIYGIDKQYIYFNTKIKSELLRKMDYLKCLIYTKDNSIIKVDCKNKISITGNFNVNFNLAYDIILIYILKLYNNKKFIMPDIKNVEYEKFIITEKNTKGDIIKYIISDTGSVNVNFINNLTIINYLYYIDLLNIYINNISIV